MHIKGIHMKKGGLPVYTLNDGSKIDLNSIKNKRTAMGVYAILDTIAYNQFLREAEWSDEYIGIASAFSSKVDLVQTMQDKMNKWYDADVEYHNRMKLLDNNYKQERPTRFGTPPLNDVFNQLPDDVASIFKGLA